MTPDALKKSAALAALTYIEDDMIVGVGTGSTVRYFIEGLATIKHRIQGAVASSTATEAHLKSLGIRCFDANTVDIPVYVDGADAYNDHFELIKGGGGALTREKILATIARQFICIVDESKHVGLLNECPLPIEVLPIARSYVGRQCVLRVGSPVYRDHYVTDNGNIILDVHNLDLSQPAAMEAELNNIAGVVDCGLFAKRTADIILVGTAQGVKTYKA